MKPLPVLEPDCGMFMPDIGRSGIAIPDSDALAAHPAVASRESIDKAIAVRLTGRSMTFNMAWLLWIKPPANRTGRPERGDCGRVRPPFERTPVSLVQIASLSAPRASDAALSVQASGQTNAEHPRRLVG